MKLWLIIQICVFYITRSHCSTEQSLVDLFENDELINYSMTEVTEVIHEKPDEWSREINGIDCAKNEIERQNELYQANELLKKSDEQIKIQKNNIDEETILVLGNAGTGKTTFSQFMAGNINKLMSMEVGNDTGEFLIVDGSKIGSSPIDSQTLYPEQVKLNSNVSYTDTPGFSDTRSPKHELVATSVMKKYLENIKKVKIVLLITYNSVQYGVYKDDLINLLRNINSFIKNIDDYKDSIVLIATKVPNTYKVTKNNVKLIPDRNIILSIAEFIYEVKVSIKKKLTTVISSDEIKFLKNAIKIIDSLEEVDEEGNPKKINIFRRPSEQGSLASMTLLQQEKELIKNTLNRIQFSNLSVSTIGYTLSNKAKIYLNCLLQYINEKIDGISSFTFQLVDKHFQKKVENYTDVYELNHQLHSALKILETLKNDLENSNNYINYVSTTSKFITEENIKSVKLNEYNFTESNEYMNKFLQFTNNNYNPFFTLVWSEHLKPVISNIKENILWYDSLIEIFNKLSSYESQKSKTELHNTTNLNDVINPFKLIFSDSNQNININYFNGENLTESRTKEFDEILSITFKEKDSISCDMTGRLIIKGYFIKISSVFNNETLKKYCGDHRVNLVVIHAYTVFIDSDINTPNLRAIKLMIAAIKWEVIGQRKFLIDGQPGTSHSKLQAEDGKNLGDDGSNGLPGYPGGNGGIFLGIGVNFKNIDSLFVSVKGGDGSSGQDGGNGAKGITGKNGYEKVNHEPEDNHFSSYWESGYTTIPISTSSQPFYLKDHKCEGYLMMFSYQGDCGSAGGKGGDGGIGGFGGNPGKIMFVTKESNDEKISTDASFGNSGIPGKGGKAGTPGNKGISSACYKLKYTDLYSPPTTSYYWICSNSTDDPTICSEPQLSSQDGKSNTIQSGLMQPEELKKYNFWDEFERYEILLKRNENKKFLLRDIKKMDDPTFKERIKSKITV